MGMSTRNRMKLTAGVLLLVWMVTTGFIPDPVDIPTATRFIQSRITTYTLGAVFLLMWYIDSGEKE